LGSVGSLLFLSWSRLLLRRYLSVDILVFRFGSGLFSEASHVGTYSGASQSSVSPSSTSCRLSTSVTLSTSCWFSTSSASSPAFYWKNDSSPSSISSGSVASVLTEMVSKFSFLSVFSISSSRTQSSTSPLLSIVLVPDAFLKLMFSGFCRSPTRPLKTIASSFAWIYKLYL
jgi:hypothetical protein